MLKNQESDKQKFEIDESRVIKIFQTLKNFKERLANSEVLKIASSVLIALVALLILIPSFFDNSDLKSEISQKISQISGANFIIKGGVEIAFLPSPAIIAKDVFLQNYQSDSGKIYNLHANSLKINLAIFRAPKDSLIKKIILHNATLNSYYEGSKNLEREDKIKEITALFADEILKKSEEKPQQTKSSQISSKLFRISNLKESEFSSKNLPKIEIKNAQATFYDRFNKKNQIENLVGELKIDPKKIWASGNFASQGVISDFKLLIKFEQNKANENSYFELNSPALSLKITGNFPSQNQGILNNEFKGKILAEIFDLKTFYKAYISSENLVSKKIKPTSKSIKISSEIENKSAEITFENLLVSSELVNGKGNINFSFFERIPIIDVNLDLSDLDLQSIWSDEPIEVGQVVQKNLPEYFGNDTVETLPKKLAAKNEANFQKNDVQKQASSQIKLIPSSIKNIDLSAEIKIKNIKYLNNQISDLDCYLSIAKEGEILFLPMTFRLPGEGIFRINGVLDNSQDLPKFIGKFDAAGKNLKEILVWLKIESSNLRLENFKRYNAYSDLMLLPNSIYFDNFYFNLGNEKSEILGDLKIDSSTKLPFFIGSFSINNFDFDRFFLTSKKNIYLLPGSLLKKLFWLNEISFEGDLDFNFKDLVYRSENFLEQNLKLKIKPGYFEISNFELNSQNSNFEGAILIDITNKTPRFELNLNVDNLQYQDQKNSKQTLFEQFFTLPSLDGFNGKVALNLDNLSLNNREVKNLKLIGNLNEGDIKNAELNIGSIYEGDLNFKGLIGIKINKTINGNLAFKNTNIQPLLSDLFDINQVLGTANISANISSVAENSQEFFKKLNCNFKFNVAKPIVEGYGLKDLVVKMFAPLSYSQELSEPEKILFNQETKTEFKQAVGSIEINNVKGGKINIKTEALAINGILSGSLDVVNKTVDASFNTIFLTGNRKKQTPINIATNLKGKTDNLLQSTNLDQVRQYLGLPIVSSKSANVENKNDSDDSPKKEKELDTKTGLKSILLPPQASNQKPSENQ